MASLTQWTWFEQALGDGKGWGSLACCNPWGHKELDMTEQLNNNRKPTCPQFLLLEKNIF